MLSNALAGAQPVERVIAFDSRIDIQANGDLEVRERIAVVAAGRQIRRGIFRDFPTDYPMSIPGLRVRVPFDVHSVTRNGKPEHWVTSRLSNGVRLRIGRAEVLLPRGRHVYEITYRTGGQLGFFATHDELFWNVNGNGWPFAMDRISAEVRLPREIPADALKLTAYTGYQGARGDSFRAWVDGGAARFETTRPLAASEGLSIAVGFPKAIVPEPGVAASVRAFVHSNPGVPAGVAGLAILFGFLYARWRKVGRDPRPGPLFPRYRAPVGMGPAGLRYVDRMGYDHTCFAAALLGLAQRGALKIGRAGDGFSLERLGDPPHWFAGEQKMLESLVRGGASRTLDRTHDPLVVVAGRALQSGLAARYGDRLFLLNRGIVLTGAVFAALALGTVQFLQREAVLTIGFGLAMAAVLAGFFWLMPAYTVVGRKTQDEIEGLRQYLGVAEGDDLARLDAPEQTPEEYAKFLAYALALGVEKNWSQRFSELLGAAAIEQAVSRFYTGRMERGFDGGIAPDFGALSATISSSSTPPGSSSGGSGGGGGGGSGGGGGGGGGGGW